MPSISDLKYVWFNNATGLTDGLGRTERSYWLGLLSLPESSLLSLEDARQRAIALTVSGVDSLPTQYYKWLALQPGGNIPGSIRDREMAVFSIVGPPPYAGKYLYMQSAGVGSAFAHMQDGAPTLGGGIAITALNMITHCRVTTAGDCHFW